MLLQGYGLYILYCGYFKIISRLFNIRVSSCSWAEKQTETSKYMDTLLQLMSYMCIGMLKCLALLVKKE